MDKSARMYLNISLSLILLALLSTLIHESLPGFLFFLAMGYSLNIFDISTPNPWEDKKVYFISYFIFVIAALFAIWNFLRGMIILMG